MLKNKIHLPGTTSSDALSAASIHSLLLPSQTQTQRLLPYIRSLTYISILGDLYTYTGIYRPERRRSRRFRRIDMSN
jgi:hypothetical protein